MKVSLETVRGTKDVLPPVSEYYQRIAAAFSEVAELYGYKPAIVPTIEHFEIYEAKSGPGISRSMYVFQDKAGRKICLRPEFTASIVRAYLKHLIAKPKPIKLYYYGQVFRYDEPQFGRHREFYQAGVEYIGEPRFYADIELFQLMRDFYRLIGLTNYSFRINDISIARGLLGMWGIPEQTQDEVLHLIDKGDVTKALSIISSRAGVEPSLFKRLLDIRASTPEELESEIRNFGNLPEVVMPGLNRLSELFKALLSLGLEAYVDFRLVRGLAYYTGTIFEVTVPGFNLSIGGGGRYDTLSQILGGASVSATGFSLGVERTLLALELEKAMDSLLRRRTRVMLISLVPDVVFVDEVSSRARKNGVVVDVRFSQKHRLPDLLGQAARGGYDYVAIIGDAELRDRKVTLKCLRTKIQRTVSADSIGDLADWGST